MSIRNYIGVVMCSASVLAGESELKITSSSFNHGSSIPMTFSCEGANKPPALSWTGVPKEAKSLVLIVDDPDAPHQPQPWVHWVVFNIPPSVKGFRAPLDDREKLADGTMQGKNTSNKIGYDGPCPPHGNPPHRYFFKLYALGIMLPLKPGATKEEVVKAMQGHILAQAELMGTYQRSKK